MTRTMVTITVQEKPSAYTVSWKARRAPGDGNEASESVGEERRRPRRRGRPPVARSLSGRSQ